MKYYLIAGEASGDLHASNLMREISRQDRQAEFRFWGGDLMKAQGGSLVRHYRDTAFMGFLEVLLNIRKITGNLAYCRRDLMEYKPDALILIDYPGFNLRMARFARRAGIRVFYYISPQVWAWKSSRVKTIRENVDRMFVILPFEKEFYQRSGYDVDFVGHPLLDVINEERIYPDKEGFLKHNNLEEKPILALLPGSRKQEISGMLPVMVNAASAFPGHQAVVAAAHAIPDDFYKSFCPGKGCTLIRDQAYDLLKYSDAAMVTSGTATLETALVGTPQVVCYRANPVSYFIARMIVDVKFISLVNLIMEKEVIRELIQGDMNPGKLISELKRIMPGGEKREEILAGYGTLRKMLGGAGASAEAASLIIQYLREKKVS